jgi:hypothetical protein
MRAYLKLSITMTVLIVVTGCAEGPLWQTGKLSPWARSQWAEEEKIADTLFVKKRRMTEMVNEVLNAPVEQQQKVAAEIAEVVHRDPILLLRIHGVKLIAQLDCPKAIQTLEDASRDFNTDIRIAAVNAWKGKRGDIAIPQLQEIVGSDTSIDVRLAATRALGNFSGDQALQALSLALNDPDPALQLRAADSLQKTTGESFGRDVVAWQKYVKDISTSIVGEDNPPSIAKRQSSDLK